MSDLQARLPPVGALVHFEAAARLGSFSRAAEELHFSQATVSRRIGQLEADLGTELFERHRHHVELTSDGELLAASARGALNDVAATAQAIRHTNSGPPTMTIFSDFSLATALVAPILGRFQRAHPDLTLRVLSSHEPIATTGEAFDIGLQYGRDDTAACTVRPVADDAVFPVCSPEFAAQLNRNITPDALVGLPLLHVVYDNPDWTDWATFLDFVGVAMLPKDGGLAFTSYQVCLDVAEQGEGVALGWERTVRPRIDAGRLVRVGHDTMPHPDIIHAYLPATRVAHPHAEDLLALLDATVEPISTSRLP